MKNKTLLLLFVFAANFKAFGAKEVGNGGNVVVCKNLDGSIASAEVFDLYEARVLHGVTYQESNIPYLEQSLKFASEITAALGHAADAEGRFINDVKNDISHLIFLPPGTGLKPINDGDEIIYPKNCSIVQTINYKDFTHIYVDTDIWNILSDTQKTALILHESVYRYLRTPGHKGMNMELNSVRARKIVSFLFSGQKLESIGNLKNVNMKKPIYYCSTKDANDDDRPSTVFYAYETTDKKFQFQFLGLADYKLFTRSIVEGKSNNGWIVGSSNLISPIDSDFYINVTWRQLDPTRNKILVRDANGREYYESFSCEVK